MKKRIEYSYDSMTGVYNGERENYITDRDPEFITLPFCTTEKPAIKKGQIAIIADDKITWKYFENKSGNWYDTKTKELVILTEYDFDHDTSNLTKEVPPSYDDFIVWNGKKWVESKELKEIQENQVKSTEIKNELNSLDAGSIRSSKSLLLYLISKLDKEELENNPALQDDLKVLLQSDAEVLKLREELQSINTVTKVKKNG